jgi:hypothetical protein
MNNNPYMDLLAELTGPGDAWQQDAACASHPDPDLWFPEGHNEKENRARTQAAQAICRACPVAIQCRAAATDNRERWGVWGARNLGSGRYRNDQRTHCKNGHEYTSENTVLDINGEGRQYRRCVPCTKAKNARSEAARKPATGSNFQGSLSERRTRVSQMTKAGLSSSEIARRLDIDARTVLRDRRAMA